MVPSRRGGSEQRSARSGGDFPLLKNELVPEIDKGNFWVVRDARPERRGDFPQKILIFLNFVQFLQIFFDKCLNGA